MEKVSVIIPVYNSEKYIEQTIKSVIGQEYPDEEIIIVNDGSKDRSIEVARSILEYGKRPYIIINQNNMGLATARNNGFKKSSGRYVCFIDSDDIISKDHISNLVESIEKERTDVAFCDFEPTTEEERWGNRFEVGAEEKIDAVELREKFKGRVVKIHACAMLFDKNVLSEMEGPFAEGLRYGEDADFIWRVLYQREEFSYVHCKSYKYLIRNNSLMTTYDSERIKNFFNRFSKTMDTLKKQHPDEQTLLQEAYDRVVFAQLRSTAKCTTYNVFDKACTAINFSSSISRLNHFSDFRVRILAVVYQIWPWLFWKIHQL